MVKMHNTGITIEVPEDEVYLYVRAGYKVVEPEPVISVEEPKTDEPVAPVEKKSTKK